MKTVLIEPKNNTKIVTNNSDKIQYVFLLSNSGVYDLQFDLVKRNTEIEITGIIVGTQNNSIQLSSIQNHLTGYSKSRLNIRSVLFDSANFIYSGLIRIEKGAKQSDAFLKNDNLLLSQNCHVQSKPYLEILEDDVSCSHGVSAGSINDRQRFYLNSRGIQKEAADQLIIRGFIDDVINNIADMSIRKKIIIRLNSILKLQHNQL